MLPTEAFKDLLDLDVLSNEENAGYETQRGMLMACLVRIPNTGHVTIWNGWWFEVVDMDGIRVDKVLASPTMDLEI